MDHQATIEHLETHGYAIVAGALDLDFCDEIVGEIDRLEASFEPSLKGNAFVGYKTVRYFDLLNQGEVWQRVAAHPNLLPVLRGVLGADMLLSTMGTAVIAPDERAQPIHRDDELWGCKHWGCEHLGWRNDLQPSGPRCGRNLPRKPARVKPTPASLVPSALWA